MISAPYEWLPENRTRGFATWDDEVTHVESQGYSLVHPEYHIPHWSKADSAPKLYVNGPSGLREMRTSFDRPARDIGYPLFFKKEAAQ